MVVSELGRAIVRNDAPSVEAMIERLSGQVATSRAGSTITVRLAPDAIHGLGWLLPRIENTLRQHAYLDEENGEVLSRWGDVLRKHVGVDEEPPTSMPKEWVFRVLASIPLTMEVQGSICSGAVRRHLAAFADACVKLLELDTVEVEERRDPPPRRSLSSVVRRIVDVGSACIALAAIVGFVLFAVYWRNVQELCAQYGLL